MASRSFPLLQKVLALFPYGLSRFDSGHVFNAALVSFAFLPLSISILFSLVAKQLPRSTETQDGSLANRWKAYPTASPKKP
jgi:hypothetical protein